MLPYSQARPEPGDPEESGHLSLCQVHRSPVFPGPAVPRRPLLPPLLLLEVTWEVLGPILSPNIRGRCVAMETSTTWTESIP